MPKTDEHTRRAYAVLDHIERNPEQHNQDSWLSVRPTPGKPFRAEHMGCGTTACYAGWTVLLVGGEFLGNSWAYLPSLGESRGVTDAAAHLLGLTLDETDTLFHDARDLPEVRKAVFEIFGPRPDGAL